MILPDSSFTRTKSTLAGPWNKRPRPTKFDVPDGIRNFFAGLPSIKTSPLLFLITQRTATQSDIFLPNTDKSFFFPFRPAKVRLDTQPGVERGINTAGP